MKYVDMIEEVKLEIHKTLEEINKEEWTFENFYNVKEELSTEEDRKIYERLFRNMLLMPYTDDWSGDRKLGFKIANKSTFEELIEMLEEKRLHIQNLSEGRKVTYIFSGGGLIYYKFLPTFEEVCKSIDRSRLSDDLLNLFYIRVHNSLSHSKNSTMLEMYRRDEIDLNVFKKATRGRRA